MQVALNLLYISIKINSSNVYSKTTMENCMSWCNIRCKAIAQLNNKTANQESNLTLDKESDIT